MSGNIFIDEFVVYKTAETTGDNTLTFASINDNRYNSDNNDDGKRITGGNTLVPSSGAISNITAGGYKWAVELFNNSDSQISLMSDWTEYYQFHLTTYYFDGSYNSTNVVAEFMLGDLASVGDVTNDTDNGNVTLAANGRIIIGFDDDSNLNNFHIDDSGDIVLLADTTKGSTSNHYAVSVFKVNYDGSGSMNFSTVDQCGSDATTGSGSDKYYTITPTYTINSNEGSTSTVNSIVRLASTTRPTGGVTPYAGVWEIQFGSGGIGSTGVAGDPYISTLCKETYCYDENYTFVRLFDNCVNNDRIIINGKIGNGIAHWADNKYMQEIYISYKNKRLHVNLGWRGQAVSIIENNGFTVNEETLAFNEKGNSYCYDCRLKFKGACIEMHREEQGHTIPDLVRNKYTVSFTDTDDLVYTLTFENVNEYNTQPGRFNMLLSSYANKASYSGLIADRKWAYNANLTTIQNAKQLIINNNDTPMNIIAKNRYSKRMQ
jgi:hypothetical protein